MPRARTKRLPELFEPTWVVVPFAASTAAAGLYLVWVHRGQKKKRAGEDEEPVIDLKPSAQAQYLIQNPDKAAAKTFYTANFKALTQYWNDQVETIFRDPFLSSSIRPELRPSAIKARLGLHDGLKKWFAEDRFECTNMEDAKKAIRTRIEELKRFAR